MEVTVLNSKISSVNKLREKLKEALSSVLPILIIVLILTATIAPVPSGALLSFLIGAGMLIVGMMLFTLGAEMSMTKIGESVGSAVTKSKKLFFIIIIAFITGIIVTVAEPDLQVLARQIPGMSPTVITITVSVGVGIFLVLAVLRIFFAFSLSTVLIIAYAVTFGLAFFVPPDFLAVAFDSGGVTTGPMTVPFIMAFGIGIAGIRADKRAADDSFGLVSLCSVGPIIAVMVLGIIYKPSGSDFTAPLIAEAETSSEMAKLFFVSIPEYLKEMAISLLPIAAFFMIFKLFVIKMSKNSFVRIVVGIFYTYAGLVIFLTGVNVGFLPVGFCIGEVLAGIKDNFILVPIAMIMGFFVVKAEPAVYVLNKQVEEMTDGGIPASTMGTSLSVGVALSLGLSVLRILLRIPIMYFLVPGYLIAIVISFFVPKMYTAIAFDSGGVASGPMTAAFLLPFAQGVCSGCGGNVASEAFGIVAMVAMTPLITIQVLGLIDGIRKKSAAPTVSLPDFGEDTVIDL